jgi:hypothetical protein
MSIKNFFLWSYWFSMPLLARGGVYYLWFGFFGAVLLAGIVLFFLRYHEKDSLQQEVFKRFGMIGVVMGLYGLIWLFFRQERIPFFAWRFWLIPWVPLMALWALFLGFLE